MQRVERLYSILKEFNGKQVGGKKSTRVEIDLAFLLQYLEYEKTIQQLEKKCGEFQNILSEISTKIIGYLNESRPYDKAE